MKLTILYILSQVFIIINYALVISTYQLKNRKRILVLNLIALVSTGLSYACLHAYSGIAMVFIGILRNTMFYIDEKKGLNSDEITKRNIIELSILILLATLLSILTYEEPMSLMCTVATITYTISIWQKNTAVYKILGIPIAVAGISYSIYISSVMGVIFESFSLLSSIIGFIREHIEKHQKNHISKCDSN